MQDDQKHFWLLVIPVKIWLYKYLKARSPELFEGLANKLIPWRGKMDAQQGLGSIGEVKESLAGGVVEVDIGIKEDLGADLQKIADKLADGWQKNLLTFLIAEIKQLK